MKLVILFVGLLSLLIANVNAFGDNYYNQQSSGINCEEIFNVTSCNECQQTIWGAWSSDSTCAFYLHLIGNTIDNYIEASKNSDLQPYDLGPYDDAVKETCSEPFTCHYEEAEQIWKEVEKKCPHELSTKVDWSADPTTIDITVASAYGTILFYYLGIPDHNAHCDVKSSSGELCGIEYIKPLVEWIKEKIPDGKFVISYDGKFVYSSDGTKFEIPRELVACTECMKKMGKEYKDWPEQHPLPDYIVENVFGSWQELEDYYTCPNDKLKRAFGRRSAVGSPGLARFRLKFKL